MKELTAHMGMIHRWFHRTVSTQSADPVEFTQFGADLPAEWSGFGEWMGSIQQARFWPRRMLHETTVHRIDIEFAAGGEPQIDSDTAVDGIDELLFLLSFSHPFRDGLADVTGGGQTLHLHATDADVHWLIRRGPDGYSWEHVTSPPAEPASVSVTGKAADLHLLQVQPA